MDYDKIVLRNNIAADPRIAVDSAGSKEGCLPHPSPGENRGKRDVTKPSFVVHSYPVYIADWRDSETRMRLNLEQRGLLWELIFFAAKEGSLPTDEKTLVKIVGCTEKEFQRAWPSIKTCFYEDGGRLHHKRVDKTLLDMTEYRGSRSKAGKSGAEKRWQSHGKAIAELSQSQCDSDGKPIASLLFSSTTTTTTTTECERTFDRLYERHPKKQNKVLAEQALAMALLPIAHDERDQLLEKIEAAHEAWCKSEDWTKKSGQFAPVLNRWLTDRGWEDTLPASNEWDGF